MSKAKRQQKQAEVIPLFGRDEMNLIEFPFGPLSPNGEKTFQVDHPFFDRQLGKEVSRKLLITGSDAFGLPRPVDDQVLMGMKALTCEASFSSQKVTFTRYQLCKVLGWPIDGRSYKRIEESLDRIAGTTLKFQDSWWDKGDELWTSQTFHLVDNVSITTRTQMDRARLSKKNAGRQLCSFSWNEVIWKSFQDGYIKKVDMELYRKISKGRRTEVALRLFRILDKKLYRKQYVVMDIRKLCVGVLGLSENYCPSEMERVLERATKRLISVGYLREVRFEKKGNGVERDVVFIKAQHSEKKSKSRSPVQKRSQDEKFLEWFGKQPSKVQDDVKRKAIQFAESQANELYARYSASLESAPDLHAGYLEVILTRYLKETLKKKAKQNAA